MKIAQVIQNKNLIRASARVWSDQSPSTLGSRLEVLKFPARQEEIRRLKAGTVAITELATEAQISSKSGNNLPLNL